MKRVGTVALTALLAIAAPVAAQAAPEDPLDRFEAVEGGDLPTSKWVLERRTPEYSPRQRVDMTVEAEMDDAALLRSLERLAAASRERSTLAEPDEELSQDAQAMLE